MNMFAAPTTGRVLCPISCHNTSHGFSSLPHRPKFDNILLLGAALLYDVVVG
jgi:hypothetical protein